MRQPTPSQARYITLERRKDMAVHVLDCNVNVCQLLVINPNTPDEMCRVILNSTGKPIAKFRYRLVRNPVATVA